MDDAELRELLRQAPGEAPPAGFGVDEVRAASRYARQRRRASIAAASAFAVVLLAGAAVLGIMMTTDGAGPVAASRPTDSGSRDAKQEKLAPAQPTTAGQHQPGTEGAESGRNFPGHSPKQGGGDTAKDGPRADSTDGCDKVDRELANALADELPDTGDGVRRMCAPDGHAVSFNMGSGRITATFIEGKLPESYDPPPGTVTVTRQAAGGGTVMIASIPGADVNAAPLAGELRRVADELAAAL